MKKNISILFVAMIVLGLLLSACGAAKTTGNNDLVGTWASDADSAQSMTFTADGNMSAANGLAGTYTYADNTVTITKTDGTKLQSKTAISGTTLTLTDPDGTVTTWTKQ